MKLIAKYWIALFLSFFLFSFATYPQDEKVKNVLLLNSYSIGYPWSDSVMLGIQSVISKEPINLYHEFLDTKRFHETEMNQLLLQILNQKYKNKKFDAILTTDDAALEFVQKNYFTLFDKLPVIFCGINKSEIIKNNHKNFYGLLESSGNKEFTELFSKILPEIDSVYIIGDNSEIARYANIDFEKSIHSFSINCKIIRYTCESVESTVKKISKIAKNNLIVLTTLSNDKFGNKLDLDSLCKKMLKVSNIPIMFKSDYFLGKNLTGGAVLRGFTHGKKAGELLLNLLKKKKIKETIIKTLPSEYIFDYQQLMKYNIPLDKIPKNAIILNKPINIFQLYKYEIIILIAIFSLLVISIIFLLINYLKRKKAEEKIISQYIEIQSQNRTILAGNQQLQSANTELINLNSELEIAKEQAEESDRLKTAFVSNISHEIRTPLNAIIGFSSLIAQEDDINIKAKDYFNFIIQGSERLTNLLNDLIETSQIQTGQVNLTKREFDINIELKRIFQNQIYENKQLERKQLAFIIDPLIYSPIIITTDPIRFEQIMNHLINNAVKYTDKGEIHIGYYFDNENAITIYVKDSGIGIDSDMQKYLFERFVKIDHNHTIYREGLGLGLYICYNLVNLLNGKIWFESEVGAGTTFYISLPLNKPYKNLFTDMTTEIPNWSNVSILIAEDTEMNYKYLEAILKKCNVSLTWAKNGEEAIEMWEKNVPDLGLFDLNMPLIDGIQACKTIKKKYPSIPIIAQTAYASNEDRRKCMEAGFNGFIAKPFDFFELITAIQDYIA